MQYQVSEPLALFIYKHVEQWVEARKACDWVHNDPHDTFRRKVCGKMGEEAVASIVGGRPDYAIYDTNKYRATPDLNDDIWVKSCSTNALANYGSSWVLDHNELKRMITNKGHKTYFNIVEIKSRIVNILGWAYNHEVIERLAPSAQLGHKDAVYLDDAEGYAPISPDNPTGVLVIKGIRNILRKPNQENK